MATYKRDWDDLGRNIEEIVDRAVNSQDYQKLNQTIQQVVGTAVDLGSEAVKRATRPPKPTIVEEDRNPTLIYRDYQRRVVTSKPSQPARDNRSNLPVLYGKTGGKTAGGILKIVGGALASPSCLLGAAGSVAMMVGGGASAASAVIGGAFLAALGGCAGLIVSGIRTLARISRFGIYRRVMGSRTYCTLESLAQSVGKSEKFVRRELQRMIGQGYFLQGHLDNEGKNLITSHETYQHYEQSRLALEARQQEERIRQVEAAKEQEKVRRQEEAAKKESPTRSPEVQDVLDRGTEFLVEIRRCNDRIPGEEISEKISRMELIVQRIFQRAEEHPEIVPDLKKMMSYYLPMTVKLLKAYADMDAQPVQGQTIQSSKREIEDTLDTLNLAFEKLLDSVFQETALDVSSDISVLNTLLAQEGLVEDELTRMKKNTNSI